VARQPPRALVQDRRGAVAEWDWGASVEVDPGRLCLSAGFYPNRTRTLKRIGCAALRAGIDEPELDGADVYLPAGIADGVEADLLFVDAVADTTARRRR
jgi:hypothetical protein